MNILIAGCSKIGARLARLLENEHNVSIIARKSDQLDSLEGFSGFSLVGIPIDQDVLKQAGIENSDCFIAVTEDDNINLMACQMADKFFSIPLIISHIYEPAKEQFFEGFNIKTVSSTDLTLELIDSTVKGSHSNSLLSLGNSIYSFPVVPVPEEFLNRPAASYKESTQDTVFGILKKDQTFLLYDPRQIVREGDSLVLFHKIDHNNDR